MISPSASVTSLIRDEMALAVEEMTAASVTAAVGTGSPAPKGAGVESHLITANPIDKIIKVKSSPDSIVANVICLEYECNLKHKVNLRLGAACNPLYQICIRHCTRIAARLLNMYEREGKLPGGQIAKDTKFLP